MHYFGAINPLGVVSIMLYENNESVVKIQHGKVLTVGPVSYKLVSTQPEEVTMINHKYTSFEVYDDLDGLPAIRSTINEARQTAKRMVEKHGQAWIYGEPATHTIKPLHFVEFWQ